MELHLLPILVLISIAAAASHAALPSEVYWNSVLPNTPMPRAIRDILLPGGVKESTDHKRNPLFVDVKPADPGVLPIFGNYFYGRRNYDHQQNNDTKVALFFFEKDMQPGTRITIDLSNDSNVATFLPHQVANSIPFSSKKLPEILKQLSLKPESIEAGIIKHTIEDCETPAIEGEERYCATSLEAMIDFSTSILGRGVEVISAKVEKATQEHKYRITTGVKKLAGNKAVVCHKVNYAYAVFYCHKTQTTKAYMVPLVGENGTKAKVVAVCHMDTSGWNPMNLAFLVLKVKPGTVPVCHFLPKEHVIWIPKHVC